MESFEHEGQWWFPEKPNQTVAGKLSFSDEEGISLDLNGSFRAFEEAIDNKHVVRPIIVGITKQGKLVTLVECESRGTHISMPGFISEGFYCHYAFVGEHFDAPEELNFHKALIQLSHLPDWVGISGLRLTIVADKEERSIEEVAIGYKHPEEIVADTSRGKIAITFGGGQTGDGLTHFNLRQNVYLRVEVLQAMPFKDLLENYVVPLQYLVGFGTNRPNSLTQIELYSTEKTHPTSENKVVEKAIKIYLRTRYNKRREDKRLYSHDMLFSYSDIASDFSNVLERWFALQQTIDSVVQLYFSVQQTPDMYLQQQFMNLVQAAESYHRRVIAPPVPPDAAHLQRLEEIYVASPQHREWLEKKLAHSHEPTLPDRLDGLYELTKGVIGPLIKKKKSFIHKTVATRNYQTHYDPATNAQAVRDIHKLYYLTQVVLYMVRVLLLREMGLSDEQCIQLFKRNEQYNFASTQHPKS